MCGGFGDSKEIDEDTTTLCNGLRDAIQTKLSTTFTVWKPETFQTQVVAGVNYLIKIQVDGGKSISVKIFKPLPHTGSPATLISASNI